MNSIFAFKNILLFCLVLTAGFGTAQPWTQTKGPAGGFATDLIERNGVILAGSLGGVYRTTDNGETWSHAMNGIPANSNITYFAQTTNYIYAAGNSEGLYRTSDGGLTWAAVPINLPSIFILELYAIGETLYIGCEGAGVIRSVNGGPFEFVNSGFGASAYAVAFAQAGGYIFCGLAGNGGTVGVYRSPVDAISWTQLTVGSVLDLAVQGTDLYLLTQTAFDAGLFKSTDLGNDWFEPLVDFDDFGGSILAYQGALYTTPDAGLPRKSVDGGASWTVSGDGLKPLSALCYLGTPTGIFIGSERGMMRSTDQGQNWQAKTKGFTNVSTTSLYVDGSRLYATAHTSNLGRSDGVFYTEDNGENWIPMDKGLQPNPEVFALVRSGSNIIIGTGSTGLYRKPDSSDTFEQVTTGIPAYTQINVLLSSGQYVLAGASGLGEIYRSTDYGVTWSQSNTGFFNDQEDQVWSLYNYNGVIFAGAFNALYKSTDNGLTWTNSSTGIYPGNTVYAITALGNTLFAGTDGGIYKSADNGATWVNTNAAVGQVRALATLNGVLYAGSAGGIHISSDNGVTWNLDNSGLQLSIVFGLAVSQGKLFAATEHTSVWLKGAALATDNFEQSGDNISIAPNPSSGIFSIAVGDYHGDIEIAVFNALGQQVLKNSVDVDGDIPIDVSAQPAGIYLVNIRMGNESAFKKIIIK